jgi:hypothetical protein
MHEAVEFKHLVLPCWAVRMTDEIPGTPEGHRHGSMAFNCRYYNVCIHIVKLCISVPFIKIFIGASTFAWAEWCYWSSNAF